MQNFQNLIDLLDLLPHPEGGFFKETYRADLEISKSSLPSEYSGSRNASTAIYFLLNEDNHSNFHKIHQDEIWHFYQGAPLIIHCIDEHGKYWQEHLGLDLLAGQKPQIVIPGGVWFGATVLNEEGYSLVGCTVAPGFDFADFELANRSELLKLCPKEMEIIADLTL